jgi:ketosteroid isomerase-like protein
MADTSAQRASDDPDIAFVLDAFQSFDVQERTLEEYHERFWQPDGVIEFVDGFPISGTYQGIEGYRRWYADSYGPYDDVQRRLDSITKEGDRVVALLTVTGRPNDENLELEVQLGNTYELEDGRIKRLNVYVGHDRALAAAREGTPQ